MIEQGASLWPIVLSWLVPIGLGMLACGTIPPERTGAVIRVGWTALAVSVIGYWLCGFAFQFGGVGFFLEHPDLAGLVREWVWKPLGAAWGGGALGLEGYMLRGAASTPAALLLFLSQLPWIVTTVALVLWSLQGRAGTVALFLSGVLMSFLYTLFGNWTWGGGWLAGLGLNLKLGHGFVDVWGIGAVHLASAASALAGMLAFGVRRFAQPVQQGEAAFAPMPSLYWPVLATWGAWLTLIGWIGWGLSNPFSIIAGLDVSAVEMSIGLLLSGAGGAFVAGLFSWLTTGESNGLMAARGAIGALVAAGAGVPFMPFWAALAVGAVAGLLVPLIQYLVEHLLRLDDPTSAMAAHGFPALWGLLAVGLFADGHAGQGWNQVGAQNHLGVPGQGVAGYWPAAGYVGDWPGQFQAQLIGAVAILLVTFFLSWLLFAAIQGLTHAWQGEYTIRLPKRPRTRRARSAQGTNRWPHIRFVTESEEEKRTEGDRPGSQTWRDRLVGLFRRGRASRPVTGAKGPDVQADSRSEEESDG